MVKNRQALGGGNPQGLSEFITTDQSSGISPMNTTTPLVSRQEGGAPPAGKLRRRVRSC